VIEIINSTKEKTMSIQDNIIAVQDKIKKDPNEGVRLKGLAVAAILGGMPGGLASEGWITYMNEFTNGDPKKLARLTTENTDCSPYTKPARAYLVGNGICLPATESNLLGGINDYLDVTLQDEAAQ
jgi:hypothetical protein